MARIKKQLKLSRQFHTCTCDEHTFSIDWNTSEIVDIYFHSPERYIPEGRTMWLVSTCRSCRNKILHGHQLCDPRITGKRLLGEAIRSGTIYLPSRKQAEIPHTIKGIWENYNSPLRPYEIQGYLFPCT